MKSEIAGSFGWDTDGGWLPKYYGNNFIGVKFLPVVCDVLSDGEESWQLRPAGEFETFKIIFIFLLGGFRGSLRTIAELSQRCFTGIGRGAARRLALYPPLEVSPVMSRAETFNGIDEE